MKGGAHMTKEGIREPPLGFGSRAIRPKKLHTAAFWRRSSIADHHPLLASCNPQAVSMAPIGPQLPGPSQPRSPSQSSSSSSRSPPRRAVAGPQLPANFTRSRSNSVSSDDDIGPSLPSSSSQPDSSGLNEGARLFLEREARRTAAAESARLAAEQAANSRPEWMLVPPSLSNSSLQAVAGDPLNLKSRGFAQSTPRVSARASGSGTAEVDSSWTETPQQRMERMRAQVTGSHPAPSRRRRAGTPTHSTQRRAYRSGSCKMHVNPPRSCSSTMIGASATCSANSRTATTAGRTDATATGTHIVAASHAATATATANDTVTIDGIDPNLLAVGMKRRDTRDAMSAMSATSDTRTAKAAVAAAVETRRRRRKGHASSARKTTCVQARLPHPCYGTAMQRSASVAA
ncbi:hypothetical protein L1887_58609 [Cichorium endivia]|nr:hypothetical protein L1887_58609 [Cichorium endivia]